MLSKEETQHIADLARLGLSDQEIAEYQKDLSGILDYIDKLRAADTEGARIFTHSIEINNVMRSDVKEQRSREDLEKLRKQMPQTKDNYLKVKAIF